jgi:hypothetical protein
VCGLAGVVRWSGRPSGEDVAAVLSMLDAQAHRGPDDWGLLLPRSLTHSGGLPARARARDHVRTYDDDAMGPAVILGARRLSIVDLSPRGHMPMGDERGRLWVTHNGDGPLRCLPQDRIAPAKPALGRHRGNRVPDDRLARIIRERAIRSPAALPARRARGPFANNAG